VSAHHAHRYLEPIAADTRVEYTIERVLETRESTYQMIEAFLLRDMGAALFLDGLIQTAEIDEFIYHEALVHPACLATARPRRALVAGGGDGGALRELAKYAELDEIVMVELDPEVVAVSAEHLPMLSVGAFDDDRVRMVYGDARREIERHRNDFDVIILDLTEPIATGPSQRLFTREFYAAVRRALRPNGVIAVQTAHANPGRTGGRLHADVRATLTDVGFNVASFFCTVPSFQSLWSFALGTLAPPPLRPRREPPGSSRYLNAEILHASMAIPPYLDKIIAEGDVRTDASPFVWTP